MQPKFIQRRQFLLLSASTLSAVVLSQCRRGQSRAALTDANILREPGGLTVALEARYGSVNLGGWQVQLMSYNGQIPGPLLEIRPGETVRLHLRNGLKQPTNLHYHGLHIPPTGNADNVFLSLAPGEALTYEFTLPKNHPAGTFYYHPHRHGFVAEQVFSGLGGILIVRGELDAIPEIQTAEEHFLFLKDFSWDSRGRLVAPGPMDLMQGREGQVLTVNGQHRPKFTIPTGGLLRLRIVNASASRFYRLALEEHPFYLIATDGGAIAAPVELSELLLAPGERAEVLIRGNRTAGQYQLLNLPYDRGGMSMMGGMMSSNPSSQPQIPQSLATLVYRGSITPLPLPEKLLTVESLPEPRQSRRFELSMAMGMGSGMAMMGGGMAFTFNGQTFDHRRVDTPVQLGSVEDWELLNIDPDRMDHPFHLHINAFQVISRNGQPEPYRAWKDTVLVRGGETVRIRIPFRDFAGRTVYHCHILDHEDLGMMGVVEMQA